MEENGGSVKVYRGGSWVERAGRCPSAVRYGDSPGGPNSAVGFLVALVPRVKEASKRR